MKKIFTIFTIFIFSIAFSQFVTPGNGTIYTLTSLSTAAPTVLINQGSYYQMASNITISNGDTLLIDENTTLKINSNTTLIISGTYNTTANNFVITATDPATPFRGIQFDATSSVIMKNTTIEYGGGMRVFTGNFQMDNCIVRYHKSGLVTGSAIQFSTGSPKIINSQFIENDLSAVAFNITNTVSLNFTNNYVYKNSKNTTGRPQISLGPSGPNDSIRIVNNTIIGDRNLTNPNGGIAVQGPTGAVNKFRIEGNTIKDNRFGITSNGANTSGYIKNNIIENNNTEPVPNNGGSGIALYGTSLVYVSKNQIRNNLWGITVLSNGQINLGSDDPSTPNLGQNIFANNGNSGLIYALFNNTANPIQAKFNCWRENELSTDAMVEEVISHQFDDSNLGLVTYSPYNCAAPLSTFEVKILKSRLFPNPNSGKFFIDSQNEGNIAINDASGRLVYSGFINKGKNEISLEGKKGLFFATLISKGKKENFKLIVE